MSFKGIDTAAKLTKENVIALVSNGIHFVGRYLVPETYSKALTKSEAETILANGAGIVLLYEIEATRARKGEEQGKKDGESAKALAYAMNVPKGTAIYFCVDYDAPAYDYAAIESYLYAAKQAVSPYKCGVYGKADLINSVKADCYMQCVAWSNGMVSEKNNIYQYQWQGGKEAQEIRQKCGVSVDMESCDNMTAAGIWMPNVSEKTLDMQISDAMKWAKSLGIYVEGMQDASQIMLALYRYHCAFGEEDSKVNSGLLS